jgi:hypothetical protein
LIVSQPVQLLGTTSSWASVRHSSSKRRERERAHPSEKEYVGAFPMAPQWLGWCSSAFLASPFSSCGGILQQHTFIHSPSHTFFLFALCTARCSHTQRYYRKMDDSGTGTLEEDRLTAKEADEADHSEPSINAETNACTVCCDVLLRAHAAARDLHLSCWSSAGT